MFKSALLVSVRLDTRTLDLLDQLSEPVDGNRSMALRQAIRELAERRGLTAEAESPEEEQAIAEVAA